MHFTDWCCSEEKQEWASAELSSSSTSVYASPIPLSLPPPPSVSLVSTSIFPQSSPPSVASVVGRTRSQEQPMILRPSGVEKERAHVDQAPDDELNGIKRAMVAAQDALCQSTMVCILTALTGCTVILADADLESA
ncbi:hypothetical protein PybrP1_005193 [[Pythium] brassicae (nom. inval.)]|nr:hypothetical protein PybrP1_005193 [[Pythium] brassicae (nom. inval.)]